MAREADSVEIHPLLRKNFPNQAYGSEAAAVLVLGVLGLALSMTGPGYLARTRIAYDGSLPTKTHRRL